MYWFYRISDMIGYNLYLLHHARDHVLYVYVYVEFDCKMNARSTVHYVIGDRRELYAGLRLINSTGVIHEPRSVTSQVHIPVS